MQAKISTLEQVAREAGVSPSTVSRILNGTAAVKDSKREAVERAINKLNYQPNRVAQALASGRSMTIGVLTQNIASPFYGECLEGVEKGLAGTGYTPIFANGHWDAKEEAHRIALLASRQVDGLIVLTGGMLDEALVHQAARIPVVVTGRQLDAANVYSFWLDDRAAAREATAYLISLGHHQIAHICGAPGHPDSEERQAGYKDALAAAGIAIDPRLIVQGEYSEVSGVVAVSQLLSDRIPFTAIFAANDQMALGARLGLYQRGIRVPEDVSLVGFDDLPYSSYMAPPLTTVRQPAFEIGMAAAQTLVSVLSGQTPQRPDLRLELITRDSTRRLR
ncbi:transcriptional regulator, LacI family [Andreprevotia lacus DSM 23236]|jgi:LacI family transcriptional regulator|uniref:Transcriptional regulator, LacI family n=1 Tax=Andreprevotia lacus DSM 23236 TaxID=1121001 RepID=A0A1W1X3P9_9NEIS|nr:LacI family DNA-binding transcriptional regulator [Andreprevotia lacus]SMC18338.1 transcriptional regulator, LacI family [Andreprevotia lacus DSM 23236]